MCLKGLLKVKATRPKLAPRNPFNWNPPQKQLKGIYAISAWKWVQVQIETPQVEKKSQQNLLVVIFIGLNVHKFELFLFFIYFKVCPVIFQLCPHFFLKYPHFFKGCGTLSPFQKFLGRTLYRWPLRRGSNSTKSNDSVSRQHRPWLDAYFSYCTRAG